MMKFLMPALFALLPTVIFAQVNDVPVYEEPESDIIYFKDGKNAPGRKDFISDCMAEMDKDHTGDDINLNTKGVCGCMIDAIGRNYTYAEYKKIDAGGGKKLTKEIKDKKSPMYKEAINCVVANMGSPEGDSDGVPAAAPSSGNPSIFTDDVKDIFVKSCADAAKKSAEFKSSHVDANVYCNCTWEKIKEYGLSLADLTDLSDPNSLLFNKIVTPCVSKAMGIPEKTTGSTDTDTVERGKDIIGDSETERVDLLHTMGVYKLKVKVGSVEKYFVLDSGAGDVFISSDYERELLLEGLIKKADYKSSKMYILADGKQVDCRRVVLNGIQVGGYTVNNITAAITDQKNALLLLGKSFLDKFTNWSIDNSKEQLVLVK
jgi:hypothetical protein